MNPKLDILPANQRTLWGQLRTTPKHFVLYGGTALALRLGHRKSVDFDFFSDREFDTDALMRQVPYLKDIEVLDRRGNTLTGLVDGVQVSYFGMEGWKQIEEPDLAEEAEIKIASMRDIAGTKAAVVQKRAAWKDYVDIHAILQQTDLSLEDTLVAGRMIYGKQFNPILTLKALSYFKDLDMEKVPNSMRKDLEAATQMVDTSKLDDRFKQAEMRQRLKQQRDNEHDREHER